MKSNKSRAELTRLISRGLFAASALVAFSISIAHAQDSSIYVQCPEFTDDHPGDGTAVGLADGIHYHNKSADGSAIKCDHLTAGDGMTTMADDAETRQYVFGFNRVSLQGEGAATNVSQGDYPSWVMDQGTLSANSPAPTIVLDEDDEYYLSLTNTGMIMRPDLFDPHTVHWHGFPQASPVFDGVPDSSISIAMGATLTYYYKVMDAGTYMYHCHVEATEHMQMGMLGNLFVHPRQNRCDTIQTNLADLQTELASLQAIRDTLQQDWRTTALLSKRRQATRAQVNVAQADFLAADADLGAAQARLDAFQAYVDANPGTSCPTDILGDIIPGPYAYNDGDGSTRYDVEYPIQMGSFDPEFHNASFNTQPLPFADMRDRFFMLNGRGYPDTVADTIAATTDPLGRAQDSQPVSSKITAKHGDRILLRITNLNVTDIYTLGVNGLPMEVVALDGRLLRDDDGGNMYYKTNSVTIGGGQAVDAIIDTSELPAPAAGTTMTLMLYTKNLDKLANDAENIGGMMTEIQIAL